MHQQHPRGTREAKGGQGVSATEESRSQDPSGDRSQENETAVQQAIREVNQKESEEGARENQRQREITRGVEKVQGARAAESLPRTKCGAGSRKRAVSRPGAMDRVRAEETLGREALP